MYCECELLEIIKRDRKEEKDLLMKWYSIKEDYRNILLIDCDLVYCEEDLINGDVDIIKVIKE